MSLTQKTKIWYNNAMQFPEGLENTPFTKQLATMWQAVIFFSDARPDQQKSVLFLSCTSTKEAYFVTFSRQFLASTWQLSYLSRVRPLPVQNSGVSSLGVPGVPRHPQILEDQLTLSQPGGGGRLCPPNNAGTPGFSDLPTAVKFCVNDG